MITRVRPRWTDEHFALAATATWIWRDRETRYPGLIEHGRIGREDAAAAIRAAAALAHDWKRVAAIAPADTLFGDVTRAAKRQVLAEAHARITRLLGNRRDGGDLGVRLELIDTLLWHIDQQPFDVLWCVDTTLAARAGAAPIREAA